MVPPWAFHLHVHEDACALNNLGVSMMLRGKFQSAAKAFKDSISVLRMLVSEDTQAMTANAALVKSKVQNASILLSQMNLAESTVHLNVLDSNDFFGIRRAFQDKSNFSAVFLRDSSLAVGEIGVGIVLYNYGVACALHAVQIRRNSAEARQDDYASLFTKAHRSLMLAYSAFSTAYKREIPSMSAELFKSRGCENVGEAEAFLFSILAGSAVSKLLWLQQDHCDFIKADRCVQELIQKMDAMDIWIFLGEEGLKVAVAA